MGVNVWESMINGLSFGESAQPPGVWRRSAVGRDFYVFQSDGLTACLIIAPQPRPRGCPPRLAPAGRGLRPRPTGCFAKDAGFEHAKRFFKQALTANPDYGFWTMLKTVVLVVQETLPLSKSALAN